MVEASTSPGGSGAVDKVEPIDNKIEQAMDLVKSHLLLAVREEVDVLKANISKLVDKISVLERENEVLKTNASPEVLAQLEATQPSQAPSPTPGAAAPPR
ncbi:TSC22 domain family protein 1-like [Pollicipes pollicipes]|uniref:TSC22 domain family protein 1-like n=1 Tax=Pollicipes pollicipes TaxID=41117 RepID=UPI0018849F2B|nr:TSC22 domain family protein 1-like [Pollicipes pollicipes]